MAYFDKLFGNDGTKNRIAAAIKSGTLPHAFLISGPQGSGKKTLSLEIAAALNCQGDDRDLPCHRCKNCMRIYSNNFTDISYLRKPKDKATIGVEAVRTFRSDMFLSSTESGYKIYVIEDAHTLTPNAQNALLKVLEEPPNNVIIFLLCEETDKILSTIKSRTQAISMQRFSKEELLDYILKHSENSASLYRKDKDKLLGVIQTADGNIGRVLKLSDENALIENSADREITEQIILSFKRGKSYEEIHTALSNLPSDRTEYIKMTEQLITAVRDLITLKYDENAELLFFISREHAKSVSSDFSAKRLMGIFDILTNAITDADRNVSLSVLSADVETKIKLL